ncbi:transmembrane protein, putative (macronuclear) [Tetrahymena thermophila SB210]|uniref:Transmembrane protein, putative n=1 Tax=Tetrahymena thermophila (strain SB210) TaxID=312017 RepID=I7LY29_TETTS|nr:transmembrane protein, putative [Tetrahymena thermophila SB210]EAS07554.2 transmembrane protein, putative [Tetrahymena thermophila SB210]|eukprot:XP_001027796.2 transmembrane protein, putative [Tetrahymena thermophila SB210]
MASIFAVRAALKDGISINQVPKNSGDNEQYVIGIENENIVQSIQINMQNDEEATNRAETDKEEDQDEVIYIDAEKQNEGIDIKSKQVKANQNDMTNYSQKSTQPQHLLQKFKTFNSSMSLSENYFQEDRKSTEQLLYEKAKKDPKNIKNYFIKFRFGQFFEFFIIHFLYFFLIGPLIIPFLRFRGKALAKNLLLYGWNKPALFQFIFFTINITNIIFFFCLQNSTIKLEIEIVNNISVVLCRCVIIACKYATYDPLTIKLIKEFDQEYNQIVSDFFLTDWVKQSAKVVGDQIYFVQRTLDIDPGLFYIQFITEPEKHTGERIAESFKLMKKALESKKDVTTKITAPIARMKETDQLHCGYAILHDMINKFQCRCSILTKHLSKFVYIFSLERALAPIIYNCMINPHNPYGNWHEYYIAITSAYQVFSLYCIGGSIMTGGLIDMLRKLYMLRQLTFMISPNKLRSLEMKKIYPTINIFRSVNLKGWSLMRQVALEYGKPYLLRVQGFYFYLGFWVASNLAQIVLGQFGIILQNTAQLIQNYSDLVFTLGILFGMLITGAKINQLFELQENILTSNKTVVTDMLLVGKKYIQVPKKSQNYIYNKALEKITEISCTNFTEYVNNLINQYDNHIEELIYDSEYNPFTLFGVKVTFVILHSIAIAVASILASVLTDVLTNK